MSDQNNQAPAPAAAPVADLDTKLAAITQAIEATNARNASLEASIQQIVSMTQKPAPKEELSPYADDFVDKVIAKSVSATQAETARQLRQQQEKQNTVNQLALDYPELANSNSDLTKEMVKAHAAIPKSLQDTPEGYRLAAREAAAQLGLVPKSKRPTNDDFSVGSSSTQGQPSRSKKADKVSEDVLAVAELMGLNVEDPKVVERLTQHSKRNYNRYQ